MRRGRKKGIPLSQLLFNIRLFMYFYRKNSIIFIKLISIGRQFNLNKIAINKTREV